MGRLNFEALKNLQNNANDLLQSPIIRQTLVVDLRQEKRVHEVCEASLRTLDVCGVSKDVLLLVKQHIKELQYSLRRFSIGGEVSHIGRKDSAFNCYRKKLKKETIKCLNSLKAMKCQQSVISDENLLVVVEALREVRVTTISIVEALLGLIAKPWLNFKSPQGSSGTNFASKFKCVSDQSLYDICDAMEIRSATERLEAVEIAIDCIEVELDCIFRRLIEMRVSLLNILTN